MRILVIVVFTLAALPAHASKSCMTMAEARQQFKTSHLYWHGSGHCWDATAPQHRIARVKPREDPQARQDTSQDGSEVNQREPGWRNAMSEMLPGDGLFKPSAFQTPIAVIEPLRLDWLDRWVDIAQAASPDISGSAAVPAETPSAARRADPLVTPVHLILMFFGLTMTLAFIELLFTGFLRDWRS
jgi:hypothetical protein